MVKIIFTLSTFFTAHGPESAGLSVKIWGVDYVVIYKNIFLFKPHEKLISFGIK